MRIDVLTLFPELFAGFLAVSIPRIAIEKGILEVGLTNIRDFASDRRGTVDDRPFGGGPGMVLLCEPIFRAAEALGVRPVVGPSDAQASNSEPPDIGSNIAPPLLILLSPEGTKLDQRLVEELAQQPRLLLLCGHYEGFDERIKIGLKPLEISVGDYVLSGGELPAMTIIDAVARLLPGVLGDPESLREESFSGAERGLEYPQYTRPRIFREMEVPEVLLSGNHARIAEWRREQGQLRTRQRRPDLVEEIGASPEEGSALGGSHERHDGS